jgi:hypothetical protein
LLKNYTLKPGLRYEYTTINADFKTDFKAEIPSYGTLVPSVNASRKLKNGNMIKLAYNRRIQRPSLRFLNPNIEASNPQQQGCFYCHYPRGYSELLAVVWQLHYGGQQRLPKGHDAWDSP